LWQAGRLMRRLWWVLLGLVVVWALGSALLFALDHGGKPERADAVVVLEGSNTRLPLGLKLVRQGYAHLLIISRGDRKKLEAKVCAEEGVAANVQVICFTADPSSTKGEAEELGRLAAERHLETLDIVTSQFHVFRARMILGRCFHGKLNMVGASQPAWKLPWYELTEDAKLAYQLTFDRGC
jgi:uncharacterized SAM-binding protein YcdF (DUF218 family)